MTDMFKLDDLIVKYNEVFIKSRGTSGDYIVVHGTIYEEFKGYFTDKYKLAVHKVIADFVGKSLIVVLDRDEIHTLTLKMLPDCKISIDVDHDEHGIALDERIVLTFPL